MMSVVIIIHSHIQSYTTIHNQNITTMDTIFAHTYDGFGYMYGYVCDGSEYTGYYTPLATYPCLPKSLRKKVKYNNIQEQSDFATAKYNEVLTKYLNTPCCNITSKMQDDVWAWGVFSETVLPMLAFIDE